MLLNGGDHVEYGTRERRGQRCAARTEGPPNSGATNQHGGQSPSIKAVKLSLPKIISGRIGGAVQPGSEWRGWCQNVGLLDARVHLSVMPSACAPDCNTPHRKQELAAGATHQRSAFDRGIRGARCRSESVGKPVAVPFLVRMVRVDYRCPPPAILSFPKIPSGLGFAS